ncbi:hypothetical protein OROHE_021970 [Orobanche hederae]
MEFLINPLDPVKQLRLLQALLPGMGENTMAVYMDYRKSEYRKIQQVWKVSEFRNLCQDRWGKYVEPRRWTYDLMKRYEDYILSPTVLMEIFDMEVAREKVISGGSWMVVFDHYVAVRKWEPDFVASEVKINKTLVWIRFPDLGMEYYDESVLFALAFAVGSLVRVDIRTVEASQGKFARVCVGIDLDKPEVGKLWFQDWLLLVEYEGLHLLCKKCGLFGNIARNCEPEEEPDLPNGEGVQQSQGSLAGGGAAQSPKPTDTSGNHGDVNHGSNG